MGILSYGLDEISLSTVGEQKNWKYMEISTSNKITPLHLYN